MAISSHQNSPLFPTTTDGPPPASFVNLMLLLFKAACATDAFTITDSFKSGIGMSLFACLFMLCLTQASLYILARTWTFGAAYSYEDVWKLLFGPRLIAVPKILLVIAYLSCTLCGFWEISDYIPDILASVWPSCPPLLLSPWFLQYVALIPFCLPSLVVRNITSFVWTGWVSFFSFIVSFACLVWHFFRIQWDGGFLSAPRVEWIVWDLEMDYRIVSDYNIAFFAHSFFPLIVQEMANPTRSRTMRLAWWSFGLVGLFSFAIPLMGYLLFSGVEYLDNVFYALNPTDPEVWIGKIAVLMISLCSTLLYQYHVAGIVATLAFPESGHFGYAAFWANIALALPVICVNMVDEVWSNMVYDLGSVAFTLLGFVLPPVYYFKQFRLEYAAWGIIAFVVLALGLVMLVASVVLMIETYTAAD